MKRLVVAAFFVLLPTQGIAKEQFRKFRLSTGLSGKPQIFLGTSNIIDSTAGALPGVSEYIKKENQMVGPAAVQGTWRQTIYRPGGEIAYTAGAVIDGLPGANALDAMEADLEAGLRLGLASLTELQSASRIFPATLEIRKNENGEWLPYWRVEYLTPAGDMLRYVILSRDGKAVSRGEVQWDGIDGRAMVFPKGPKLSELSEVSLRDLSGDGTIAGRLLRVFSALDLKVWSPELTFFFSQDDRRFDLGQAYYTINQGFQWLKERLGIEINRPIDVRLHVGQDGISNAAFYHSNTIYLGTGDGIIYKDMLRDPSILIHEGIHSVIDAYVGLPSEGEGGSFNEGFADLFAALILDNPRMGEASYLKGPYRRTLENNLIAYKDFIPGVYQNGSIVGATFWDMKSTLGTELTAKLAFRTMVRLGRGAKFDDFYSALLSACEGILTPDQQAFVMTKARNRGWKIP